MLKDPYSEVQEQAAEALENIGAAEAVPHLIPLLNDPDKSARAQAAGALGNTSVKLDNSNEVQSTAGKLLWCLTDVKEVAKSAFISLMNTANHLSVLEVNSLKLVDPVSDMAQETKMKKALRWIRWIVRWIMGALIALILVFVGDLIYQIASGKFMHFIAGKEILVLIISVPLYIVFRSALKFVEDKLNK